MNVLSIKDFFHCLQRMNESHGLSEFSEDQNPYADCILSTLSCTKGYRCIVVVYGRLGYLAGLTHTSDL